MSERRGQVVEVTAIEYPIPDEDRNRLIKLGEHAVDARRRASQGVVQTEEGETLLEFEVGLRERIGVQFSRPAYLPAVRGVPIS